MVSRQTKDERTPFSPYANHDHISAKAQVVKEGYRRERFSTVILNGVSHVVILEGASRPIGSSEGMGYSSRQSEVNLLETTSLNCHPRETKSR